MNNHYFCHYLNRPFNWQFEIFNEIKRWCTLLTFRRLSMLLVHSMQKLFYVYLHEEGFHRCSICVFIFSRKRTGSHLLVFFWFLQFLNTTNHIDLDDLIGGWNSVVDDIQIFNALLGVSSSFNFLPRCLIVLFTWIGWILDWIGVDIEYWT